MSRTALGKPTARWLLPVAIALSLACVAQSAEKKKADAKDAKSDEAAIRASEAAFVAAFNRGDAKALALLWTPAGTLLDEQGQLLKGRAAIEKEYAALFTAYPGAKLEVAVQSIEFPAPGMAVEDGMARAVAKDGSIAASRYTAIHVLTDGKWLMASVRESGVDQPATAGRLDELAWLVGKWQAKSAAATVETSIRWVAQKSFLQREYTVKQDDTTVSTGVQIIGWDPKIGRVRSWSFDGSGGHGTSVWTPVSDGWRLDSTGVLADGTPTSSQERLIRAGGERDLFGWRSTNRKAGAAELPDTREVVLHRVIEKN